MEVPRHWRLKKQRYALVGEVCPMCKTAIFPPRAVCPYCGEGKHSSAAHDTAVLLLETQSQAVHA